MTIPFEQIPGPQMPKNLFGQINSVRAFSDNLIKSFREAFAEHGDVVAMQPLGEKMVLFRHPDHIHEALVTKSKSLKKSREYTDPKRGLARFVGTGILTANGDFWRRQRKQVSPAFHTQRITAYADAMVTAGDKMLSHWPVKGELDIAKEMMHVTLDIISGTISSVDLTADADRIDAAMDAINAYNGTFSVMPTWIPTPMELRVRQAVRDLDDVVYNMIAEWRKHGEDDGSLLSMLMLAEDEDGNHMTDKQIRDESVTLILAGHETTANALNWTFKLLSENPDAEAKLHEELDRVLQGRLPELADLQQLPYTDMVVKESLRLYPPAWGVSREAVEDVEIGDYLVPKGALVSLNFFEMHHDGRWWDEPNAFRPERWSPENAENINKHAYMPFGGGPRVCVGNAFAQMEANLLLATIAQRYSLTLTPGQVVIPDARITMYPRDGLPMIVEKRDVMVESPVNQAEAIPV